MIEGYEYALKPFDFKHSFYCTDGFCAWWDDYYFSQSIGDADHMLGMVESGFILLVNFLFMMIFYYFIFETDHNIISSR
jgi:hypothetical protein